MKKMLIVLFLWGSIGITKAESIAPPSLIDFDKILSSHRVLDGNTLEGTFLNYKPCKEFTKIQSSYQTLYQLGFIKDFGLVFEDGKYTNHYTQRATLFSQLATSTPKNLIQQSLFPYGNTIHAVQGNGTQIFCENDNFYQMGTLRLKGHVLLQEELLEGSYEGSSITSSIQNVYFIISEFKDTNVEKLPYVEVIEGEKAIFLGCFPKDETYEGNITKLSVNIDTVHNTYTIDRSLYDIDIVNKMLFNNPELYSQVPNLLKQSAKYPDQQITIETKLNPNVIFDHGLDIPCENSRVQSIEIIDDGGLL